jgi:hypothetical protein
VFNKQKMTNKTMTYLIQSLFDGPLDIVGDVHGEIDALRSLLVNLGYDENGRHPQARRLVFLGDLTDRGPDSPAVLRLVKGLVESGLAQCVLGNHDFNILLEEKKQDNHWFFKEEWSLDNSGVPTPAVLADDHIKDGVLSFFRTLPLALERDTVRVVHACWDTSMVEVARNSTDVLDLYHRFTEQIDADHKSRHDLDDMGRSLERQNRNPVKVLTSGIERPAREPFVSGGKLRHQERVPWWTTYNDEAYCVFGHYGIEKGAESFAGRAICIDFNVGKRWKERKAVGFNGRFKAKLGAMRLPEAILVFDDGESKRI